ELLVVAALATGVGVTLDPDALDLGVIDQDLDDGLQDVIALLQDLRAGRLELHLLTYPDLSGFDTHHRTSVARRVVVARAGIGRAGVLGVDDAVAVGVLGRRAAVLLGILRLLAGFRRARVLGVHDPVAVLIGRRRWRRRWGRRGRPRGRWPLAHRRRRQRGRWQDHRCLEGGEIAQADDGAHHRGPGAVGEPGPGAGAEGPAARHLDVHAHQQLQRRHHGAAEVRARGAGEQ